MIRGEREIEPDINIDRVWTLIVFDDVFIYICYIVLQIHTKPLIPFFLLGI